MIELKKKIDIAKVLGVVSPILVAIILSFGNDYIMMNSLKKADEVDLLSLERQLFISNACLMAGLFLAIFLSNLLFRIIIRQELVVPLQKLREGMARMRKGDYDYRIPYEESDVLFEVYDDFNVMAAEMQRFAAEATSVDEGRKRLLLGISHDLRSPLTSIIAYVQGLLDGIGNNEEKRLHYLNVIKQKSLEIEAMVNRLFTFAKLDNKDYKADLCVCSVSELLEEYVSNVKDEYEQKHMVLSLVVEGDANVMADKNLFFNVCQNLIDNSVKYNDKTAGTMKIKVKAGTESVKIVFADNGPGVAEESLTHLWDLFYRADTSRNAPGKSNGIGLAIVKRTVEVMGGKVTAKNGKEQGLVITIRLPIIKES